MREGEFFVHRANVNDLARAVGRAQVIHKILREEEGALKINVEHEVEISFRDVPEVGVLFDACVIYQDIDLTMIGDAFTDKSAVIFEIRQIAADDAGLATQRLDLFTRLGGAGITQTVVDDDVGTLLGESDGYGLSDTLSAAGDESYFTLEFHS